MSKSRNSVPGLQIQVKFSWMILMGVEYNCTKCEQEIQGGRAVTELAGGRPQFRKLQFGAKKSHFWARTALEHIQNGQTKGNYKPSRMRHDLSVSTSSR